MLMKPCLYFAEGHLQTIMPRVVVQADVTGCCSGSDPKWEVNSTPCATGLVVKPPLPGHLLC